MMGPMGWAAGSSLFNVIIPAAQRYIKDPKARRKFYLAVLPEFNDHDWDTQQECEGMDPVFDKILKEQGYLDDDRPRDDEDEEVDDFADEEDEEDDDTDDEDDV